MYTSSSPTLRTFPSAFILIFFVSISMLNTELSGIKVLPFNISSVVGLFLGPKTGSL